MNHLNLNSLFGFLLILRSLSPATAIAEPAKAAPAAGPKHILSDGSPLEISELGAKLIPAAGWEMIQGRAGISLILQKPLAAEPVPIDSAALGKSDAAGIVKISYQPNIVLATMHRALPLDEKSASEITSEIEGRFKAIGGVSNFQLQPDAKIFEYRAGAKALIVYATYSMNGVTLGQMHMVISGAYKSFLLTYTDQADHFMGDNADHNKDYQEAFRTMLSFEATGNAPMRYREEIILSASIAAPMLFFLTLFFWVRRRAGKFYHDAGDASCYEGDEKISSKRNFEEDDDGVAFSDESALLLMTDDDEKRLDQHEAESADTWDLKVSKSSHEEEEPLWNLAPQKMASSHQG